MKSHVLMVVMMAVVGAVPANSAPFQNLGFEEADTNHLVIGSYGLVSDVLPGWQLSNGIPGQNLVGYNTVTLGLNYASVYGTNFFPDSDITHIIEGKFALGLYPGTADNGAFAAYHLSQMGDVPADAKTIRFTNFGGPFDLHVNGQLLPLVYEYPSDYVPNRFLSLVPIPVIGDISAFAGKAVELDFITLPTSSAFDFFLKGIDSVSFSPELIPEPSTWALFALGGIGFLFRHALRKSAG